MAENWLDSALDTVGRNMRAAGKQPIGYRKNGRPIWPMFGAEDPPAPPTPPGPAPAPPAPAETGFPANTPVVQMTVDQQAAYWKHYARQHEERNKAFGDLTPEQLTELRTKAQQHDALQLELGTTAEQAAARAAQEADVKARAEMQPQLIAAKLDAAAARKGVTAEQLTNALEFIDTSKFLTTSGSVDTAKVDAFIGGLTPPATGTPPAPRGPLVTPHAPPGTAPVKVGDGARAALAERGIKID